MRGGRVKLGVLMFAILVCSVIGGYYAANNRKSNASVNAEQTLLSLVKPVFAQSSSSNTTFLEEEAGMSAWVNVGSSLNLTKAKSVYKYVEKETPDYIIGSVSLDGYPETDDVHCFIHKDGWIVVYYLKHEPISKIIDWNYYSNGSFTKTKLLLGLEKVGLKIGVEIPCGHYYNFQYPNASKWMIIIESIETGTEDSFKIKIPSEFTVYERSWSLYSTAYHTTLWVDGSVVASIPSGYGTFSASQLSPDVFHTITISKPYTVASTNCVAVILAYEEP